MPELPKQVTLKLLLCVVMADIDIFLLQNKEQTADNDKEVFTRGEIRKQLTDTLHKTLEILETNGCDINKPMEFNEFNQFLKTMTK